MKILCSFLMGLFLVTTVYGEPLRIYVPWGAGGPADISARTLVQELVRVGVEAIVLNKPGADGLIAINEILSKKTDTNQLLFSTIGTTALASATNEDYQERFKNFVPVVHAYTFYSAVVVNSATGIQNFPQLTNALKTGSFNIASSGGQQRLLAQSIFGKNPNANLVPYQSDAQVLPQLLGGQIEAAVISIGPSMIPHLNSGALIALATTGNTVVNGVPPLRDFGIDPVFAPHYVLYALSGMSPTAINQLNQQITSVLGSAAMQDYVKKSNMIAVPKSDTRSLQEQQQAWYLKLQRAQQTK
jgi:tripartite-type tricarboxylate transporter receptor subunit TctC